MRNVKAEVDGPARGRRPLDDPGEAAPSGSLRRAVALLVAVRVPMQHGVLALALLAGAVIGMLLAGQAQAGPADLLPPWMPSAPVTAAVVSAVMGAMVAGLTAWLVCRPRRAQQWTIEYPQRRTISLQGIR